MVSTKRSHEDQYQTFSTKFHTWSRLDTTSFYRVFSTLIVVHSSAIGYYKRVNPYTLKYTYECSLVSFWFSNLFVLAKKGMRDRFNIHSYHLIESFNIFESWRNLRVIIIHLRIPLAFLYVLPLPRYLYLWAYRAEFVENGIFSHLPSKGSDVNDEEEWSSIRKTNKISSSFRNSLLDSAILHHLDAAIVLFTILQFRTKSQPNNWIMWQCSMVQLMGDSQWDGLLMTFFSTLNTMNNPIVMVLFQVKVMLCRKYDRLTLQSLLHWIYNFQQRVRISFIAMAKGGFIRSVSLRKLTVATPVTDIRTNHYRRHASIIGTLQ